MRISVPNITVKNVSSPPPIISISEAIRRIIDFLVPGVNANGTAVLTGAGCSRDSGVRTYRGKDGRYINPNYKPIFYHELVDKSEKGHAFRKRYWLRSYLGYPPVRDALPNTTHYAIAAGMHASIFRRLVTQNVDGLHHKAIRMVWDESRIEENILELHGSLFRVHCDRGHVMDRDGFQIRLANANPRWKAFTDELERTGRKPRTNPDGDIALEGVSYDDFVIPECPSCLAEEHRNFTLKPAVTFFGESIESAVKARSFDDVERCNRLMVIGTTLATYSAFRIVRHALELKKPVLLLNVGPTRADGTPGIEKIEVQSGIVMPEVIRTLIGARADSDQVLKEMLTSGVVNPPPDDEDVSSGKLADNR